MSDIDNDTQSHNHNCDIIIAIVDAANAFTEAGDYAESVLRIRRLITENPSLILNRREYDGASPLHIAAELGLEEVVEILLQAGANPNDLDSQGYTPLDSILASECKRIWPIVAALLNSGGKVERSGLSINLIDSAVYLRPVHEVEDVVRLFLAHGVPMTVLAAVTLSDANSLAESLRVLNASGRTIWPSAQHVLDLARNIAKYSGDFRPQARDVLERLLTSKPYL